MASDVFGIDPGTNGGAAWISGCCCEAIAFKKTTRMELVEWFVERGSVASFALVEKVSASPQMGVVSSFTFGRSYERPLMALTAAGVRFERVMPRAWQKAVGLIYPKNSSYTEHKQMSRARAQEIFPEMKVTNAIADALLIARAAERMAS